MIFIIPIILGAAAVIAAGSGIAAGAWEHNGYAQDVISKSLKNNLQRLSYDNF